MASRIEDYALHRRQPDRRARRPRRVDRLAVRAPLRLRRLLRRAARHRGNGRWLIAPAGGVRRRRTRATARHARPRDRVRHRRRRGRGHRLHADPRTTPLDLVRVVEGVRGRVPMRMELAVALRLRLDRAVGAPRRRRPAAVAGPTRCLLRTPVARSRRGLHDGRPSSPSRAATGAVRADLAPVARAAARGRSTRPRRSPTTEPWWREWAERLHYDGDVAPTRCCGRSSRSRRLTYAPTGGIVAAATTSLPEAIGGVRNWDYRYCWLRDATFTLSRAACTPATPTRPRPGATGCCAPSPASPTRAADHVRRRRRAPAHRVELDWLPGYEGSRAGAHRQRRRTASSSSTSTAR